MTTELLLALVRVNLAGGLLILLVLALRRPARRLFGPSVAYGLWFLPLLGGLASLIPARVIEVAEAAPALKTFNFIPLQAIAQTIHAAPPEARLDFWSAAAVIWLAGATVSLVALGQRQRRFLLDARQGRAGPAVAGVLFPKIVVPADFADRYSAREQAAVMAHEQTHLRRQDPRVIAFASLLRCINWFNPLVHVAVHHLRMDQELACDAQVIERHPKARRAYADAMLKTQLAVGRSAPLGCHWPPQTPHPLAERITLLTAKRPNRALRMSGAGIIALAAFGGGYGAWSAQPPRFKIVSTPAHDVAPKSGWDGVVRAAGMPLTRSTANRVSTASTVTKAGDRVVETVTRTITQDWTPAPNLSHLAVVTEEDEADTPIASSPPLPVIRASWPAASAAEAMQGQKTRVVPWTGGDRLAVSLGAEVRYVVGADDTVVIIGPAEVVSHVIVQGGSIRLDHPISNIGGLKIIVTAPRLTGIAISGPGKLVIGNDDEPVRRDTVAPVAPVAPVAAASIVMNGAFRAMTVAISDLGGLAVSDRVETADLDAPIAGLEPDELPSDGSGGAALGMRPSLLRAQAVR